ncbi:MULTISPECIES: long-chain fatty acid--CoA ligase [unclassified Lentimicrobium]|uniref:AMP-dependent synthetase/ligase n=1 Tax=unclassified Lentimicrobium TaxID=2677434 RepID=UPI0015568B9C|nr:MULTISPECIES: AMP-binding protein [unclassified Lentimicrobium]NPD46566.1 AMP-binding protein [Lentimicrobium sp. S6]NPD85709.1 AMP-binding protein [Lentimicrobium sp. L6]
MKKKSTSIHTIVSQLEYAAEHFESKTYLADKEDSGWLPLSFSDVKLQSRYLALSLHSQGLKKGEHFSILSEGSSRWVISEFSLLYNGMASVPLSVKLMDEELPFRLNHSESKGIFISKNNLAKVLNIWNQIDNKDFKLIYLDHDIEYAYQLAEKQHISKDHIWSYFDLIEKGKEDYLNNASIIDQLLKNLSSEDVVTVSYTSGTTGNPKGIMLTHKNYMANSAEGVEVFKANDQLKTLIILPVDHCFAHTVAIFGALFSGMSLYFLDARGGSVNAIKNIPINLNEVKPNFLLTVPALSGNLMKKIIDGISDKGGFVEKLFHAGLKAGYEIHGDGFQKASWLSLIKNWPTYFLAKSLIFSKLSKVFGGNLQYMVGGGALLDIKQQQFFYTIGFPIYQGYGLTEATPIISSNTPFIHKLGTSGMVLPSIKCKIMNENGEECKTEEKGEIVISGDNVMKGYFKNTEASEEYIKNGCLWTGDLGYMDKNGFLVVTGREKALLIAEDGEKYSPEEIEEGLVFHAPLIQQAMLYNNQKRLTTSIITLEELKIKKLIKEQQITSASELLEAIHQEIKHFKNDPVYKVKFPSKWMPSLFYIAQEAFSEDNKQVNSTLKMVRHKIEEAYQTQIDLMYSSTGNESIKKVNEKTLADMYF